MANVYELFGQPEPEPTATLPQSSIDAFRWLATHGDRERLIRWVERHPPEEVAAFKQLFGQNEGSRHCGS
jgi:hypothetical protein